MAAATKKEKERRSLTLETMSQSEEGSVQLTSLN
jgi:hypothetical protein